MWTLIIYGVLAICALAAIHGFDLSRQNIGAAKQLAADKPILAACVTDKDTAVTANKSFQTDLEVFKKKLKEQNDVIDDLAAQGEKNKATIKRLQDANATLIHTVTVDKADALARAANVKKGQTCEQAAADIDTELRNLRDRELRDRPPAPASSVGDSKGGPNKNTGPDTVRLIK